MEGLSLNLLKGNTEESELFLALKTASIDCEDNAVFKLLCDLQYIHDRTSVRTWKDQLAHVAEEHNLQYPV